MSKKSFVCSVLSLFALGFAADVRAQSYSSAVATGGGTAISQSSSYGNARSVANAAAHGGQAVARQSSWGRHGGFADGVSTANTIGGYAGANGRSEAYGPGYARNVTTASAHFGSAIADGRSISGPFGRSDVHSTALSDFGRARSSSYGSAAGGEVFVDGLSHSFGPVTRTRTVGTARGYNGGYTRVRSVGYGVGIHGPVSASAAAHARAYRGYAQSSARHVVYGGY